MGVLRGVPLAVKGCSCTKVFIVGRGDAIVERIDCIDLDDKCDDGDVDNYEGDAEKDGDSSGEVVNANLIHAESQFCH